MDDNFWNVKKTPSPRATSGTWLSNVEMSHKHLAQHGERPDRSTN